MGKRNYTVEKIIVKLREVSCIAGRGKRCPRLCGKSG